MRRRWIVVICLLLVVITTGCVTGFFHNFAVSFSESRRAVLEGHRDLPSCDSESGLANARTVIDDIPILKQNGVTVLGISDAKPRSTTESDVECDGIVTLSSAVRGPVHYSFAKDPAIQPFLVRAKIDQDELKEF